MEPAKVPTPIPRFDPKEGFKGASAMDRAKKYLKDVPVLHARMERAIQDQEAVLEQAKACLARFEAVTEDVKKAAQALEGHQ